MIGYAVSTLKRDDADQIVANLNEILTLGGSAWEASRGVEGSWQLSRRDLSAAQPVVSPGNGRATLGTIIADMKAKSTKWRFALGDLDLVIQMSERLWKTHIRHGTDGRTDHTLPEADAALHLAIPLVRYFAGGLVETA